MINPTLRHDTLRQWPVERLPSFEDDEDDAVETVRMPDRPWHDPAPSSRHSSQPSAPRAASSNGELPRTGTDRLRAHIENAERWFARLQLRFARNETKRSRWSTAIAATALFTAFEILDAHTGSSSIAAHAASRAVHAPPVASAAVSATPVNAALPNSQTVESLPLVKPEPSAAHSNIRHPAVSIAPARSAVAPRNASVQSLARRPFDAGAVKNALDVAASNTRRCTRNQMAGTVVVLFSPSGEVTDVTLGTLAGDVIQTHCVIQAFRNVRVAPFAGRAVRVRKTFAVSQ